MKIRIDRNDCLIAQVLVAAMLAIPSLMASAQAQTYPAKPVRFVSAFAPGGPVDVVARIVGQKLGETWGQQVLIENRAGAAGNIGSAYVAKQPADGYTVLVNSSSFAVNVSLTKDPAGAEKAIADIKPLLKGKILGVQDAAERRDEMPLRTEVVHAVANLARDHVEVIKAAAGEDRGQQLHVFADHAERPRRIAQSGHAFVGRHLYQRAVAAVVHAAGVPVAFSRFQDVLERGDFDFCDFRHSAMGLGWEIDHEPLGHHAASALRALRSSSVQKSSTARSGTAPGATVSPKIIVLSCRGLKRGHGGRPYPLGSPVFAKLVQSAAIVPDNVRSASRPGPDRASRV